MGAQSDRAPRKRSADGVCRGADDYGRRARRTRSAFTERDGRSEGGRDAGAEPREPVSQKRIVGAASAERGSRDFGRTPCGQGLLAELRDPAFCFLLVVQVDGRSQIVAQLRNYLVVLAHCEMDLR